MKNSQGLIALSLVTLLAACGSHAPKNTATAGLASSSATTPAPDLNAELLGVGDLPAGWSVVGNTDHGPTPPCFAVARSDLTAPAKAQVTFVSGPTGLPVLGELLAYLPGRGESSMTAASQVMSGCGHISLTSGGQTLAGSVTPVSFPAVADQSSAYQVTLSGTVSGTSITLGVDVVVFRKGDTVAVIQFAELGTAHVGALEQIVQQAATKLS